MPLPDGYRPREGDVLIIHCTTKYEVDPSDTNVHVVPPGRHSSIAIDLTDVAGLHCRKWNEDDRVMAGNDAEMIGDVKAIFENQVWVRLDSGRMITVPANELEPEPIVEPPPPRAHQD